MSGDVALVVAVMAGLALLELAVPLFARGERGRGRLLANGGLTLATLVVNQALAAAVAGLALVGAAAKPGWLPALGLPAPMMLAIAVVTLDFATWLAHVSMHRVPWLWRVHRVHHSDPFLDVTTTLRQHPLEGVWRLLWIAAPVWLLGLPLSALLTYRLLSAVQAVFEHANLRVWSPFDRALSRVWCTPNMHKVHHSRFAAQTDSNYGNLLALFDRACGTFRDSDEAFAVRYGLDDVGARRARSLPALLGLPFARAGREDTVTAAPSPGA
jgi:sterol desaturase/sphingolipid hydroxylase (fatty acid hydroxylase superfamily)